MPLPADFEKRLWAAANQLWANSALHPAQYSTPILALIFLRYADARFGRDRFRRLRSLPVGRDLGKALDGAMRAALAESHADEGVFPKTFGRFDARTLRALVELFGSIPLELDGDVFGRVYEYFLGRFAPKALQKGGEFYTPVSIVRLIVEILEPYQGKVLDPACGSGGMFVQSAKLIRAHEKRAAGAISLYGIEKVAETLRLARMNLAVHGLSGNLIEANTYYDVGAHRAEWGKFDFVAANPPFNQGAVDRKPLENDARRFPFGVPSKGNANYLWIQLFYSALNAKGRAGFVMANSASDAQGSELAIRKKLIESGAVDVVIALGPSFFYTVTLPVMLWFLDKGKARTKRKNQVLFLDARPIFRQVDRTHRDLAPEQIELIANVVRRHRKGKYEDVAGLCKVASLREIERQGWSLHPGRYVGAAKREDPDLDFDDKLAHLNRELARLAAEARKLEKKIAKSALVESYIEAG
jgi:type I restriction enzyme M protein